MTPTLNPVVYILLCAVAFIAAVFLAVLAFRVVYYFAVTRRRRNGE